MIVSMKNVEPLHEANFLLYAAKYYSNPQCYDTTEFFDDLNRFKYLKRLFNKYYEEGELRERLILNHIVVLYNLFGAHPTTRMLFFKLKGYESALKTYLIYLNYMPEHIYGIGMDSKTIRSVDIPLDQKIVTALRKI